MARDHDLGHVARQGDLGASTDVDEAWQIDWDHARPARLVGDRDRINGLRAGETAGADARTPAAPPPAGADARTPAAPPPAGADARTPAAPPPADADARTPATPPPTPPIPPAPAPDPGGSRPPQRRTLALIVGAVLLVAAVAAIAVGAALLLAGDGDEDRSAFRLPPVEPEPEPEPAVRGDSAESPPDARREFEERTPFGAGGVRFEVLDEPDQQWVQDTRGLDPGAGREWHTVLVLTRNVDREALTAAELRFRLRDASGTVYEPSEDAGNGGSDLPPGAQVPIGTLVRGQLAFSVEQDSGPYELLIDASPSRLVRVELGSD